MQNCTNIWNHEITANNLSISNAYAKLSIVQHKDYKTIYQSSIC